MLCNPEDHSTDSSTHINGRCAPPPHRPVTPGLRQVRTAGSMGFADCQPSRTVRALGSVRGPTHPTGMRPSDKEGTSIVLASTHAQVHLPTHLCARAMHTHSHVRREKKTEMCKSTSCTRIETRVYVPSTPRGGGRGVAALSLITVPGAGDRQIWRACWPASTGRDSVLRIRQRVAKQETQCPPVDSVGRHSYAPYVLSKGTIKHKGKRLNQV